MDIRNWGLDQIMQLPDSCFGRRWPIGMTVTGAVATPKFDIAEMSLPERCVVWEMAALYSVAPIAVAEFEIRLGDVLPTTWAEFQQYDLLFPGVRELAIAGGLIYIISAGSLNWQNFKMPVLAAGRRLVIGVNMGVSVNNQVQVVLTVSSIPREVPDCFFSV